MVTFGRALDEGFQYRVYDEGDKVRKVPKTREEMIEYSKNWGSSEEEARNDTQKGIKRRKEIERRFEGNDFEGLADFCFEGTEIVQEKVVVTKEALQNAEGLEGKKKIIDEYIQLVKECWKQGFHDMSYNFTVNTGINSEGERVQIDLGDLIFSRQRVKREVANQKWLEESWSYEEHLKDGAKEYYRSRMSEEVTIEEFKGLWRREP